MIKRIEMWLRRIFSDEASKVETSLRAEIEKIQTSFAAERDNFLAEVRNTIESDLKLFRADLVAENALRAVPQHWHADPDSVKADHQLRHPRPARR